MQSATRERDNWGNEARIPATAGVGDVMIAHHDLGRGLVVDSEVVVSPIPDWLSDVRSTSAAWSARTVAGLVIAVRLVR